MNTAQRDLWRLIRRAVRLVDGVYVRLSAEVARLLVPYANRDRWTTRDRLAIRRDLDRLIDRYFGRTQRAAVRSILTLTLLQATDAAAETPFRRMLARIESAVTRRDPALWDRLRARLLTRAADDRFAAVVAAFEGPAIERQRIIRAGTLDPQRRWVNGSRYRLSDRVWQTGRQVRQAIDARLVQAVRRGDDPIAVARELERYLHPAWQPLRFGPGGRIVVDTSRKQVHTMQPRGGHGSSPARRLARTEIVRIHGMATIEAVRSIPGAEGIRWQLSARHPKPDDCTDNAMFNASEGMEMGVYRVDEVPRYPNHPNELCTLVPVMQSRTKMLDDLVSQYGEDWWTSTEGPDGRARGTGDGAAGFEQ